MANDMNPQEKRQARKGMGWAVVIVLLIILAIFVGYNVYYAATPG